MVKDCSKDKSRCIHSKEAVSMLLSHAPHRLTIQEISGITNYHRNTVRSAIKDLLKDNRVKATGSGNNTRYYYDSISDHYKRMARTMYLLDIQKLNEKDKLRMIRRVGYNLVKDVIEEVLNVDCKDINHSSLYEALVHVKMAYPFIDMEYKELESGKSKVCPSVYFVVEEKNGQIDPNNFNMQVHPCLCNSDPEQSYACAMVAGALQGAIEGTLGVKAKVEKQSSGVDEEFGQYCTYNIKSTGFQEHQSETQIQQESLSIKNEK